MYLDTISADVYLKTNDTWSILTNIQGSQGEPGLTGPVGTQGEKGESGMDGATWLTGKNAPINKTGKDKDLYLNTISGDVYLKTNDAWSLITSIQGQQGEPGPTGPVGPQGEKGEPGMDGATWLTGEGAPINEAGRDRDLYLDIISGDVMLKTDGSWSVITNLGISGIRSWMQH